MENKRESFKSSLGFILVSAGCAIGLGNVWKFPYVAGQNGGGIFVLFYLLFLVIVGVPLLTMELSVGRASGKGAVESIKVLEKKGHKWHLHGWVCIIGCTLLMMYYTTVSGWIIGYFARFAAGAFSGIGTGEVDPVFNSLLASPGEMLLLMGITVFAGTLVCSIGLQKGIERITKIMMLGLLALIILLAVNSLLLDGASEGLRFYLLPDPERARARGFGNVITAAMSQAFFTLSIGIGSMQIFGSYMSKEKTIGGEAVRICALDTIVAIASGLIIFPACFSFGVSPDEGPPLIFMTLPKVFVNMNGGRIWGTLFFLFMAFAALSTVIAVFEAIIANVMEVSGLSRKRTSLIVGISMFVLSVPCVLGYNLLSDLRIIGDRDVLGSEDFIVSNVLVPIGALVYLFFCTRRFGWGFDSYLEECNTGKGIKLKRFLKPYLKYILPVIIAVVFLHGIL